MSTPASQSGTGARLQLDAERLGHAAGRSATGDVHASVVPHEVVPAGARVTVRAHEPFDARSAQGALGLRGVRTIVRLSEDGRTATVEPAGGGDLAPGPHVLTIDEPLSAKERRLADRVRIPFLVVETPAKLPDELRIESLVRLRLEELHTTRASLRERPDGPFIEVLKAVDRETGEPVPLAFDQDGERVDADELLAEVERRRFERFGTMQEDLHARIERAPGDPVTVAVWLRAGDAKEGLPEKSTRRRMVERPEAEERELAHVRRAVKRFSEVLRGDFGAELRHDEDMGAPVLIATMPAERVLKLAHHEEVVAVFLHEEDEHLDLGTSMAVANADDVHAAGFDGTGVRLAVWESGPDDTSLLPIVAEFSSAAGSSDHARHTHGIVSNTEAGKPQGHAPGCDLHSANSGSIDALRWAVRDRSCTVVSQSFHRSSEPGSSGLQSDDVYKDWLALRWPYPTIVQAAGNFWSTDPDDIDPPESEYVNHKGFNGLAVGNHNDAADAMSPSSVFRNPASPHGDRELPEIAANGTGVTCVGLTKSGTSMAAPAAAGCTALIQDVNSTLQSWPEGCRAILMAGARLNPDGDTWWTDVQQGDDASDGAGAVDAREAVAITQQRRSPGSAGTRRGWDVGTLRSRDIGERSETTYAYTLRAPFGTFGARAKVALAWDSKVDVFRLPFFDIELPLASRLSVDLDLKVYDAAGNQVGYSGSWDNSYEIAEFPVAMGAEYTIRIRRWSGTDDVWFGLAWTVTGGIRVAQQLEGVRITR